MTIGNRELPPRPHPEHLRRQAKRRLRELRASLPEACLADAQLSVAQEYGFATWGRLRAEVSFRRASMEFDRHTTTRRRRVPLSARYRERQVQDVQDALLEATNVESQTAFFRSGAATNVGVLLVSVVVLMSVWALLVGIL